jgi:hypothetical protein
MKLRDMHEFKLMRLVLAVNLLCCASPTDPSAGGIARLRTALTQEGDTAGIYEYAWHTPISGLRLRGGGRPDESRTQGKRQRGVEKSGSEGHAGKESKKIDVERMGTKQRRKKEEQKKEGEKTKKKEKHQISQQDTKGKKDKGDRKDRKGRKDTAEEVGRKAGKQAGHGSSKDHGPKLVEQETRPKQGRTSAKESIESSVPPTIQHDQGREGGGGGSEAPDSRPPSPDSMPSVMVGEGVMINDDRTKRRRAKRKERRERSALAEAGQRDPDAGAASMDKARAMMARMGWEQGRGLGANGTGRTAPLPVRRKVDGGGVGHSVVADALQERRQQLEEARGAWSAGPQMPVNMTWEASSGIDSDDFAAGASLQDSSQARAAELHVAACSRCEKPFP